MARFKEVLHEIGVRIKNFLIDKDKVDKILEVIVFIGLVFAVVLFVILACKCADLGGKLAIAEQRTETVEKENENLKTTIKELTLNINELEKELSEVEKEEEKQRILNDQNAKIVDLIQYVPGDFDENVELVAHMLMGETRGSGYKYKVLHVLMVISRAFDPRFSNGTGDLESVIFKQGQFACIDDRSYYQTPDKDCYNAAIQVLSGNVLYYQDICRNDLLFTRDIDAICDPKE